LVVNPALKKVFAYQRSTSGGESRLHHNWSLGVGGHIEREDCEGDNPLRNSAAREVDEEVKMNGSITNVKVLGYINHDDNSVGKVHLGVLYAVETDSTEIGPNDPEVGQGKFISLSELQELMATSTFEEWSRIAFEPLKEYLES